jgi:hypothetical protein
MSQGQHWTDGVSNKPDRKANLPYTEMTAGTLAKHTAGIAGGESHCSEVRSPGHGALAWTTGPRYGQRMDVCSNHYTTV